MSLRPLLLLALLACPHGVVAQESTSQQQHLDCSAGPLSKTFGFTPWLVYACSDGKSVVVVTTPGSPAAPFYFMLFPKDGKYTVVGEGTGLKRHTDRAYADLNRLTEQEISDLVHAANKLGSTNPKK